jgi:hypothetical protein
MRGLGVLVNTAAVICGGLIGLVLKRGLSRRFQDILTRACGIATIFIGAAGTLQGMLSVSADGSLTTHGTMLLIFSLVLGGLCGEALNLEQGLERLGDKLKRAIRSKNDSHFVEGFVNASLIICVGAMAIVGSIQDGLTGDHSMISPNPCWTSSFLSYWRRRTAWAPCFRRRRCSCTRARSPCWAWRQGAVISDTLIAELSYVGSRPHFLRGRQPLFREKNQDGQLSARLAGPRILRNYPIVPVKSHR